MALSNWDILAFGTDGKASDGSLIVGPASVEIYKNWLYVRHSGMWVQETGFDEPTIAQVTHGSIHLAGFNIEAARHADQGSIFCFVQAGRYKEEVYMAGIGCYGFMDSVGWLKQNHPELTIPEEFLGDDVCGFSQSGGEDDEKWGLISYANEERKEFVIPYPKPGLEEMWLGVTPETLTAFKEWLEKTAPKEYFNKVQWEKAGRFNQGDAFFAESMDIPIAVTKPGESEAPLIGEMIKRQFGQE